MATGGLQTGGIFSVPQDHGLEAPPSEPPFDAAQFENEVHEMSADVNTGITDAEFESLIEFLQRLVNSGVDVSHDQGAEEAMNQLHTAVSYIQTGQGGVFVDQQVKGAISQLKAEGHCHNIFTFLDSMHQDSVDFSHDLELQTTMNNVSVVIHGVALG